MDPYQIRVRWRAPLAAMAAAQSALGSDSAPAPLVLRFRHDDAGISAPPYDVFLESDAGERAFTFRRSGAA